MTKQQEQWLNLGASHAAILLNEKASYYAAIDGLMFYYARKAVVMHGGKASIAGRAVQVTGSILAGRLRSAGQLELTQAAQQECERWATLLALNGAKYQEALFVFSRALMVTAIEQCQGNHCEAARRLKVHRNTTWKVPRRPRARRAA